MGEIAAKSGIGAQFGGKYFAHDVRVIRLPRHGASLPVGQIGQDDAATIDALVARLDRVDDPLWLTGDVVGALTALTGERFAYDRMAWRDWWETTWAEWPVLSKSSQ